MEAGESSLWVHWPNSGNGSGRKSALTPLLTGSQDSPASSVVITPTAEMPTHIRAVDRGIEHHAVEAEATEAGLPEVAGRVEG